MKFNIDKIQRYIIIFFRVTILIAIGGAFYTQRWTLLFTGVMVFLVTFFPLFFEKRTRINLPIEFEFMIILFLYASLFLGEIHAYYTKYWWWDAVLHTGSGVGLGFVGFLILYVLYYKDKVQAKPFWIVTFAFFFAVGMGAIWEIFEFAMDQFFGMNMQKSGLVDTMWDLIVDSVGALITSIVGYFYFKGRKTPLFSRLLIRFKKENPKYFVT